MKNYYEILEVDRNASQEVIEKAYKTLAKKYHPDLQQGGNNQESAEKMKMINDAYDTLSNSFKRAQYDELLPSEGTQNQTISIEEQERILRENYALKQQINRMGNMQSRQTNQSNQSVDQGSIGNMGRVLREQIRAARDQKYNDSFEQNTENNIIYKFNFKDYLKLLVAIILTILMCILIYQIPPIKHFFQELYNENYIFKAIVDMFKNTFTTKF